MPRRTANEDAASPRVSEVAPTEVVPQEDGAEDPLLTVVVLPAKEPTVPSPPPNRPESGEDATASTERGAPASAVGGQEGVRLDSPTQAGSPPLPKSPITRDPPTAPPCDNDQCPCRSEAQGMTQLMCAAWNGRSRQIQPLIAGGQSADVPWRRADGKAVIVGRRNLTGSTAILLAAMRNHSECIHKLAAAGADVEGAADDVGSGAAHYASGAGHGAVLQALGELKVDVFNRADSRDKTPLRMAVEAGHHALVGALAGLGGDAAAVDAKGFSLCQAAATAGHSLCLEALFKVSGAGCLNQADSEFGWTPAHAASSKGHADCLEILHQLGAKSSFFVPDRDGFVPAHIAAFNGKVECLRALDNLGAGRTLRAKVRLPVFALSAHRVS
jgi:ankyrin repeat protein